MLADKKYGDYPGIGHNSGDIPPQELEAELAALRAAEEATENAEAAAPALIEYLYEVRFHDGGDLFRGELDAHDLRHARRKLRVILGTPQLPVDTRIIEKHIVEDARRKLNGERNRRLLKKLTNHHLWLQGNAEGVRADLSDEDLSEVNFEGRDLSHVSFANAKMTGARLTGAKLVGADLSGADLSGAILVESDLSNAILSDANLIGADLTEASLKGADLWRANLARCVISPESLHQALNCNAPEKGGTIARWIPFKSVLRNLP